MDYKVLVATPINEDKLDLFERFKNNIVSLTYKHKKRVLLDNSYNLVYSPFELVFDYYKHFYLPKAFDRVALARRIARNMVLEVLQE